jgi:hypothetical protein
VKKSNALAAPSVAKKIKKIKQVNGPEVRPERIGPSPAQSVFQGLRIKKRANTGPKV